MIVDRITDEFGEVVDQLLGSTYVPVPGEQLTKGQSMAVASGQTWAGVVGIEFMPDAAAPVSIHRGDSVKTCDSIRQLYRSEEPVPGLEIELCQSLFVVAITLRAPQWPDEWKGESAEVVTRAARRFFRDAGRLDLKLNKRLEGPLRGIVLLGIQDPAKRQPAEVRDWRDSLQWWRDGTTLGFVILKRTGFGQSVLPSFDLKSNLVWFDMLERPRTG